jgi:hypothetical protein
MKTKTCNICGLENKISLVRCKRCQLYFTRTNDWFVCHMSRKGWAFNLSGEKLSQFTWEIAWGYKHIHDNIYEHPNNEKQTIDITKNRIDNNLPLAWGLLEYMMKFEKQYYPPDYFSRNFSDNPPLITLTAKEAATFICRAAIFGKLCWKFDPQ